MSTSSFSHRLNNYQVVFLVLLRLVVGWHLLYEGFTKILKPGWSSKGYLLDSKGPLKEYFFKLAQPEVLEIVDLLNIGGLIAIGACLVVGLFSRTSAFLGAILLLFYYLSHPPFYDITYALPGEGTYWIVNKNMIEMFALLVLMVIPTGKIMGLDRLFMKK